MVEGETGATWGALFSLGGFWIAGMTCYIIAGASPSFLSPSNGFNAIVYINCLTSLLLAAALYELRRLFRTLYGLVELMAMFFLSATGYVNILKATKDAPEITPLLHWTDSLSASLTFMASLYVGVRALDNIGEGLSANSPARAAWDRIFPRR